MRKPRTAEKPRVKKTPTGNRTSVTRDRQRLDRLARRALVFDHMRDGVIITDFDGRVIDWNPAAERIFGHTKQEMLGRQVGSLYRASSLKGLEESILKTTAGGGRWVGELTFVHKSGAEGRCETTVAALLDKRGRRIATIGVNRNITERRRIEAALAEAHSMMRGVVDGTSDAVFVKDRQGRYVMINAAGSRMAGKRVEEVIGHDDRDLFPPAEAAEIMDIDRRVMCRGEPYTFEETVTIAGSARRLSTTKAPWRDAADNTIGLIGISRDITERWAAEESARQHREDLAHTLRVRTIGEMAAGLGHEINQPLGAISNYAIGCVRRLRASVPQDEHLISVMEEISAQAMRAATIVRRLGDYVRRQPEKRETASLDTLVRAAARLIEREAREGEIALELALEPQLRVRVDPIQIEQVVVNLLLNGVEAIRGSRSRQRKLSVRAALAAPRMVQLEVSDTGVGLPEGPAEQIFQPFFSTKPHGLGMGLAISRSIVDAHGGTLTARNGTAGGATFAVQLPLSSERRTSRRKPRNGINYPLAAG